MRYKITILSAVLLIALSVYLYFVKKEDYFSSNANVNIDNTGIINRFVVENDTSTIIVEHKDNQWFTNNMYIADNRIVSKLFRLFKNIEISLLPKKDSVEIFRARLKKYGNKIFFYHNNNLIAKYWVYEYSASKNSTLLMNESENPIYVRAAGLSNNISQFVTTNELLWRNKRIFGFDTNKIKSLTFRNIKNDRLSFSIINYDNEYKILNYKQQKITFEPNKLARYFSYFINIEFKSVCNNLTKGVQDSIIKVNKLYTLNFDIQGYANFKLNLIGKPSNNKNEELDLNYIYGQINDKSRLLNISYYDIDPIIKEITYFEK